MALIDTGRVALQALDYSQLSIALKREILIDYTKGDIYIVSATDKNVVFNVSQRVAEKIQEAGGLTGDNITISFDGEDITLNAAIIRLIATVPTIVHESPGTVVGTSVKFDNNSITPKDGKVQLVGFDTALNNYIPAKVNGVLTWVAMPAATPMMMSMSLEDDGIINNVSIVYPNDKKYILLSTIEHQYTELLFGGNYTLSVPLASSEYQSFTWNLTTGTEETNIVFPYSVLVEDEDKDMVIYPNTIAIYTFETWDAGKTWLTSVKRYSTLVNSEEAGFNNFAIPDVPQLVQ